MNYCLSNTLKEATDKRKGHLKTLNFALLSYGGIAILLATPSIIIKVINRETGGYAFGNLFFELVMYPLLVHPVVIGLLILGINCARGEIIQVRSIFSHYKKMWSLYLAFIICCIFYLFIGLITTITIALFSSSSYPSLAIGLIIILTILLAVYTAYLISFTWTLIVDKGLGVISAYKYSIQTVRQRRNLWLLIKLHVVYTIWLILGALTLGIAYFWIIPRFVIAYGIIYCGLFDPEPENSMTNGEFITEF